MSAAKAKRFRRHFGPPSATLDDQNVAAARLILENAEPDERGLAIEWARSVMQRHEEHDGERKLPPMPEPASTRR